jgi:hypothetical protein
MAAPVPSDQASAEASIPDAGSARWQASKRVLRESHMLQQLGIVRAHISYLSIVAMAMLMWHA